MRGITITLIAVMGLTFTACKDPLGSKETSRFTGTVFIVGTPQVGEYLYVDISSLSFDGEEWFFYDFISYQWMRKSPNGVTTDLFNDVNYYFVQDEDEGCTITVTVTITIDDYSGSITSEPIAILALIPLNGTVYICGIAEEGQYLWVDTGSLDINYALGWPDFQYTWMRDDGYEVSNSLDYYLQHKDIGYSFTVTVKARGYLDSVTSDSVGPVVAELVRAQAPVIYWPRNVIVTLNTEYKLTMTMNVYGGGLLSYRLYRNTSASTIGGTAMGGVETHDLPIANGTYGHTINYYPPTDTVGTYYYFVELTNTIPDNGDGGAKTVTIKSDAVELSVLSPGEIGIHLMKAYEGEPSEQIVSVVANIDRKFIIPGTHTTYRWYLDGTQVGTSSTYTFNKSVGEYLLVAEVTNSAGESRLGYCRIMSRSVLPLVSYEWANGDIPDEYDEEWYSFSVNSGTRYYVWWNDRRPGNDAKTAVIDVKAQYSNGVSISSDAFAYDGWNIPLSFTANQTGTVYLIASTYSTAGTYGIVYGTNNSRPTIYAVSFNANGGGGTTPPTQIASADTDYIITLPDGSGLSRDGYVFGGWNTSNGGTGTNYDAGSLYRVPREITLYARWYLLHTVTFNINYGSGTAPAAQTGPSISPIILPNGSGFSRSGYTFGGWNIRSDGDGTNYDAGSSYTPSGNITLYARWYTNYTVTFDKGGNNDVSGSVPAQTGSAVSPIIIPDGSLLYRSGFIFTHWNTQSNGLGIDNYYAGDLYTPTGNITLYARWGASYTVTFNINNGSGTTPPAKPANLDNGLTVTLPDGSGFSRDGFTFGGWNTSEYGTGTNYNAGASYKPPGTITLYARWYPNFTVTFDLNYGIGTKPADKQGSAISSFILPDGGEFSRDGYVFGGWNTSVNGTGTNYNAGAPYMPTGTITLYARWHQIYTVTFDINNGIGTKPADQTGYAISPITIPSGSGFSRSGYIFDGWNTSNEGTGTNYNAGASYTPRENITFYARWHAAYTVTFDINYGIGTTPAAQTGSIISPITIPSGSGFSRNNFLFGGWNTRADGTGTKYSVGASYTPAVNITLYTQWYPLDQLSANVWADKTIASSSAENWHTLSVTSGTTYYIWWNDRSDGDGTKSGNIAVSARYENADTFIFSGVNSGLTTAQSFTANQTGTVYLRVTYNGSAGTYGIMYNTSGTGPVIYTVTFDANGGYRAYVQRIIAGLSFNLPYGNVVSRTGYNLVSWNTRDDGKGTNYDCGVLYTPTGNITLYANWEAIFYTVTYNINGGYGTAPPSQTIPYNTAVALPSGNSFARDGWTFVGWGEPMVQGVLKGPYYLPIQNITLYAVWEPKL